MTVARVKHRLSNGDVEPVELRSKLDGFCGTLRTDFGVGHKIMGPWTGEHSTIAVPIAVGLLRRGAGLFGPSTLVWQKGFSRLSLDTGVSGAVTFTGLINFEVEPGAHWVGAEAFPRLTKPPTAASVGALDETLVPSVLRIGRDRNEYLPEGVIVLGDIHGTNYTYLEYVFVAAYGVRSPA